MIDWLKLGWTQKELDERYLNELRYREGREKDRAKQQKIEDEKWRIRKFEIPRGPTLDPQHPNWHPYVPEEWHRHGYDLARYSEGWRCELEDAKPCPSCGRDDALGFKEHYNSYSQIKKRRNGWSVVCGHCRKHGNAQIGKFGAVNRWNLMADYVPVDFTTKGNYSKEIA